MSARRLAHTSNVATFAHGLARTRCDDCGHDDFVAAWCKNRGVCSSCNTRRMAEIAAHLADHVLPHLPVRQWVLSTSVGGFDRSHLQGFPLVCPICEGLGLIAFITEGAQIRKILEHIVESIGVDCEPPRITAACGPLLRNACDAQTGEGVENVLDRDLAAHSRHLTLMPISASTGDRSKQ